jgi:hypothetical protein
MPVKTYESVRVWTAPHIREVEFIEFVSTSIHKPKHLLVERFPRQHFGWINRGSLKLDD